jgi:signal transduction histidine kinase
VGIFDDLHAPDGYSDPMNVADGVALAGVHRTPPDVVRAISSTIPDGLLVIDGARRLVFANRRADEILQSPIGESLGQPIVEAVPLWDSEGRLWWDVANPWRQLHIVKGHREKLLWTTGGVEVLATARYLRPGRHQPVERVVVALRDALARQRAERDHAALISTLAHELRSPLTSVKGFSSTLLRRWDRFSDEQKRLIIETIEADADRVTRLVSDLLDVSRIEAGRMQVRRQEIFLSGGTVDMVDGSEGDARPACVVSVADAKHLRRLSGLGIPESRIDVEIQRPIPDCWADPDRIDQIMINLVENALTHGAGRIRVHVGTGHPRTAALGHLHPLLARGWSTQHRPGALYRQGLGRGPRGPCAGHERPDRRSGLHLQHPGRRPHHRAG